MIMENKLSKETKAQIKSIETEDFNKQLIPMLAVLAGSIVVLLFIAMMLRTKKRR